MNSHKNFDLIVFGATAFTGRLAARYLAHHLSPQMRWAISGRNKEKLEKLFQELKGESHPPVECFVLDHSDQKKASELVSKTRVAMTFAGPFGRYGENIVASCAEHGTHYLDITGETVWVHEMIQKYEKTAQKSGAILVPFSGFDSIPSDLGVSEVIRQAQESSPELSITQVVSLFSVKGGMNGGSFETFLDLLSLDKKNRKSYLDASLLVPSQLKKKFKFRDRNKPFYLKEEKLTAPPFFMSPINSRVVYRSQALRMSDENNSDRPFEYVELQKVSRKYSELNSWATSLGFQFLNGVGRFPVGRKLLRKVGPKAGEGPSEEVRNSGYSRARFYAYHHDQLVSQVELVLDGDPGNKATVKLICESAQCLLQDQNQLPQMRGGFWTPSTAFGPVLRERLIRAGMGYRSTSRGSALS